MSETPPVTPAPQATPNASPQVQDNSNNGNPPPSVPPTNNTPPAGTPPDTGTPPAGTPPTGEPNTPPADPDLSGADWREKFAGEDDKKLNVLKRYPSQKAALDALFAAQRKISEGSKSELPENATDEQKAAYRTENGIPESPQAYLDNLGEGVVIDESEREAWTPLLEELHNENVPQDMINRLVQHKIASDERAVEERLAADDVARDATEEALREEWGADYKANKNMIKNAVALFFPEDMHDDILNARLGGDGTPLFASVGGAKAFVEMARKLAPHGTVVSSEGVSDVGTIESNLMEFQKKMGTPSWYNDTQGQKQYQDLVDAYKRNTGKDWTGQPS